MRSFTVCIKDPYRFSGQRDLLLHKQTSVTDFVTCIYLSRIQIKKLNKGVHKLIILHARLTDAGDVTCRCVGQNETTAKLTVNKLQPPDGDAGDQETGDGKVRARGKGNRRSFSIEIIYQKSANYFWKNHENFFILMLKSIKKR